MVKFSIIIPVYNVAKYLDECLRSVLEQSYTNFEIILVDDGSTDESGVICDRYAEKDARVVVIHKANGGASTARNEGLGHMSGDYVLFLDSDDYWLGNDVLGQLASRIELTHTDVLIYNLQKEYQTSRSASYFSEKIEMAVQMNAGESFAYICENELWTACPWNKAIKAELFAQNALTFRIGITSEDIDWCLRLALSAERFDFLNLCVVGYRQRESSVTGTKSCKKTVCLYDNICECLRLLENADAVKKKKLMNYVAYQYGTLLYSYSTLNGSDEKRKMYTNIKKLKYLLNQSDHPKIRLIRRVKKIVGLRLTLCLLSTMGQLNRLCTKRSQ